MPNSNNNHQNSISKMQQSTTLLQCLTFRPEISFNDPATPDGKLWNSALKQITQSQGWSQLHWGAQLVSGEVVDLIICMFPYDIPKEKKRKGKKGRNSTDLHTPLA